MKKMIIKLTAPLLVLIFCCSLWTIASFAEDDIDKLCPVYPENATSRIDPEVLKDHLISAEEASALFADQTGESDIDKLYPVYPDVPKPPLPPDYEDHFLPPFEGWEHGFINIDYLSTARFTPGDVNNDGRINSADAGTSLRCSAKLESASYQANQAGDVNEDGKVTSADARKILRVAAKLDSIVLEREAHTGEEIWINSLSNYTSGSWRIVEAPKDLTIYEANVKEAAYSKEPKSDRQAFAFKTSTAGSYKIILELSETEDSVNPIRLTYLYTVA